MPYQTRRHFLTRLGLIASGALLDPGFLAWEPGARAFFDLGAGDQGSPDVVFLDFDILILPDHLARRHFPVRFRSGPPV